MAFARHPAVSASDRGDPFTAEVLSYVDSLYGTALRLTRNAADAEDLVQETYLKAFRFAHRFERGTNLKAWLFTILHNTFRNMRRDTSRDPVRADEELLGWASERVSDTRPNPTPEELLLRQSLGAELQAALDALPDVFRQAVWLRDVEGFTYAEIAEMLDIPAGTVMSRISRGRRMLYDHLAGRPGTDRVGDVEIAGRG